MFHCTWCSFVLNSSFAHSICKKDLASRRQSMMDQALGKRWFGFWRFKKCVGTVTLSSLPLEQNLKAHCLDQNRQSLAHKAQRTNHWAKNANLTCWDVNNCDYKVWLQKKKSTTRKTVTIWNPVHLDRIGQISTCWYVPVRTGTTRYKTVRESHTGSRTY